MEGDDGFLARALPSAVRRGGGLLRGLGLSATEVSLVLGNRLRMLYRQELGQGVGATVGLMTVLAAGGFFLTGILASLFVFFEAVRAEHWLAGVSGALMAMAALLTVPLQVQTLLDSRDATLLAPLPIHGRSILAARLISIAGGVIAVGLPFAIMPTLLAPVGYAAWWPLAVVPATVAFSLAVGVGAAMLGMALALGVLGPRCFGCFVVAVEILLPLGLVLASLGGLVWLDGSSGDTFRVLAACVAEPWWPWMWPAAWVALLGGEVAPGTVLRASASLLAAPILLSAAAVVGGSGILDAITGVESRGAFRRRRWPDGSIVRGLAARAEGPEEAAAVGLGYAVALRERLQRSALLGSLAVLLPALVLVGQGQDGGIPVWVAGLLPWSLGLLVIVAASNVVLSRQPEAGRGLAELLPLGDRPAFVRGAVVGSLARIAPALVSGLILLAAWVGGVGGFVDALLATLAGWALGLEVADSLVLVMPYSLRDAEEVGWDNLHVLLGGMAALWAAAALHAAMAAWTPVPVRALLLLPAFLWARSALRRLRPEVSDLRGGPATG